MPWMGIKWNAIAASTILLNLLIRHGIKVRYSDFIRATSARKRFFRLSPVITSHEEEGSA